MVHIRDGNILVKFNLNCELQFFQNAKLLYINTFPMIYTKLIGILKPRSLKTFQD